METTWHPAKAESNIKKHKVRFSDAEAVFFDPLGLTIEDVVIDGEQRYVTLGMDALGRILVMVYTYRGEDQIHLISARRATKDERRQYEKGI